MPDFGGWLDLTIKKGAHIFVYTLLGLSFLRGLRGDSKSSRAIVILAVLLTLAFAISDEYHQTLVEGRSGKWQDVAIDTAGASVAIILGHRWGRSPEGSLPSSEQ